MLAVGVGTWLAYLLVRTDVPWKPFLFAAALAPLAIPGVLYAIAWIFLASPRIGILNEGPVSLDVFSPGGMIVVEGFHSAPLVFLLMVRGVPGPRSRTRGVRRRERRAAADRVPRASPCRSCSPRSGHPSSSSPCAPSSRSRRRR